MPKATRLLRPLPQEPRDFRLSGWGLSPIAVAQLPAVATMFNLVIPIEEHPWRPNLPGDRGEVFRASKPGGTAIVIAEIHERANTASRCR